MDSQDRLTCPEADLESLGSTFPIPNDLNALWSWK
jgi:hypothetical protein